ncbi:MAG: thioredoxin domain-containing protein [bacterium]|nr:thioredoxin domain-containing protein [bacterium]
MNHENRRDEKGMRRQEALRKEKVKKIFIWSIGVGLVFFAVWGMWKLASTPPLSSDATRQLLMVSATDRVRGDAGAPVTLIEYLDFQCPACRAYHPIVQQINTDFPTDVRIVTRHFPLSSIHANALPAARATEAAGRQGKFFEMHDLLYLAQERWVGERDPKPEFIAMAGEIGADKERFVKDMEDAALDDTIQADQKSGVELGVMGTPTFFLNGKKIDNPRTYEDFKALIVAELNKK